MALRCSQDGLRAYWEEFIRFMSGQASWRLRLKVMMTMPKWPFIRGVSKLMNFQQPRKVAVA
ncbi:MAG: hypothetical protein CM15mP18_3830 [Methanobacteriota archaeon]|nr:MAG: hypothetical protein CM15mP18_3830 [Euryarchaeota archaeon]